MAGIARHCKGKAGPKGERREPAGLHQGHLHGLKGRGMSGIRGDKAKSSRQVKNTCETTPSSGKRNKVTHSASGGALLTGGVISDMQRGAKNRVCRVQPSSPHHAANHSARRELAHLVLRSYRRVTAHEHRGGPMVRNGRYLAGPQLPQPHITSYVFHQQPESPSWTIPTFLYITHTISFPPCHQPSA